MENISEKEKEAETLEKISARKQHEGVMAWAHCPEDVSRFIEKISDGLVCECLYFCAIDGMPLQEIQKMFSRLKGTSREKAEIIWKERQRYLQKLYGETSEMGEKINDLYQKAKQVFLESEKVQKSVEKHMTYTLEMQKTLLAEQKEANKISLSSKDEVIREKEKQMKKLEQELQSLQEKETSLREENRQMRQKLLEQEKEKNVSSVQVPSTPLQQPETTIPKQKYEKGSDFSKALPHRASLRDFFRKPRREKEGRDFIEIFLNDKEYSQEQRDYLLRCLEEGDSVRDIRGFASPKLTVEMMQRLRSLQK